MQPRILPVITLALSFLMASPLTLLSQEEAQNMATAEDDRVGVTVEKVERADSFPERLRREDARYLPPKGGNDFALIHVRVVHKRDLDTNMMDNLYTGPACPVVTDDQGKTYRADYGQFVGLPPLGSAARTLEGYIVFTLPKQATPVQLRYVYAYRETGDRSRKIRYGQIDIDLSRVPRT